MGHKISNVQKARHEAIRKLDEYIREVQKGHLRRTDKLTPGAEKRLESLAMVRRFLQIL